MIKKLYKKVLGSQLRVNMASGVVCTVVSAAALMVGYPLFLNYLGFELYGVWLVLTTVLTFARLGDLGIKNAIMKMVAEEFGKGNVREIQRYVATGLALLCVSGGIILLVLLTFRTHIIAAFSLSDENARIVLWLLPYIGVLSIYVLATEILQGTLAGLGRMDQANYIWAAESLIKVTVAGSMLASGFGVQSLLIGSVVSHVMVHLASLFFIRQIAPIRIFRKNNIHARHARRMLQFGGTILGGSLIGMITKPLINLLLARYAGVSSLPVYEIAYQGSMKVRSLISVGLHPLMPEFSRLSSMVEGAGEKISQLYSRAMKLILIVGLPLYVGLLVAAPTLLQLWLRESFVEAIPRAFQVMLIAGFIKLFGAPAEHLLVGLGSVRSEFLARCMEWLSALALITSVAITTGHLSPLTASLCIVPAFALATLYRTLAAWSVMARTRIDPAQSHLYQKSSLHHG